jgi:hypothetical protein
LPTRPRGISPAHPYLSFQPLPMPSLQNPTSIQPPLMQKIEPLSMDPLLRMGGQSNQAGMSTVSSLIRGAPALPLEPQSFARSLHSKQRDAADNPDRMPFASS